MSDVEGLARTVANQRVGDESRWPEFITIVEQALERAAGTPGTTARDYLDAPAD